MSQMALKNIIKGPQPGPDRILLMGVEGVGKSTFAANAPSSVFLAVEDGSRHLDVSSFPRPRSFGDVLEAVNEVATGAHDFKRFVVDSLGPIDAMIRAVVKHENKWDDAGYEAYGAGVKVALTKWRLLMSALDRVIDRGIEVIVIAHPTVKSFRNPEGTDFMRYEPDIGGDKPAAEWKRWADMILFAQFQETVTAEGKNRPGKASSDGTRVLMTTRSAAYDAKNRHNLPPCIPLDWSEFESHRKRGRDPAAMAADLESLLKQWAPGEAQVKQVRDWVGKDPSAGRIFQAAERVRQRIEEKRAS